MAASRGHRHTLQAVHKVVRGSKRGYWNDLPKRIDGTILYFPNDLEGMHRRMRIRTHTRKYIAVSVGLK